MFSAMKGATSAMKGAKSAMKGAKSAMKGAKSAMKKSTVMKATLVKRSPKMASGKHARSLVFQGKRQLTSGRLQQDKLMKNKRGKIVSKKANARGKRLFHRISGWISCLEKARKALNITGFHAVNGPTTA